jgi:hypothetical protein
MPISLGNGKAFALLPLPSDVRRVMDFPRETASSVLLPLKHPVALANRLLHYQNISFSLHSDANRRIKADTFQKQEYPIFGKLSTKFI